MTTATPTGKVFVSYSHRDMNLFNELRGYLSQFQGANLVDYWMDSQIKPGAAWRRDISNALRAAKVAILLLSPDFLASDFIQRYELPPLIEAAKAGETQLLGVILKPCQINLTTLAQYQAVNPPQHPLATLPSATRAQVWMRTFQLAHARIYSPPQALPADKMTRDRLKAMIANRDWMSSRTINLSGQDLSELNLSGLNLRGVNLSRANLRHARLADAVMGAGVLASGFVGLADLSYVDLSYADLSGANLNNVNLRGAILRGADLSGANLNGCNLRDANLYAANLTKCQLHGLEIKGASFEGVNAEGADFQGIINVWKRVNFAGATLQGVNLSGVDLTDANLREVNLRVAKLKDANLTGANLEVAQLQGANLRSAKLKNANLTGADLTGANLRGAEYNRGTEWPAGFDALAAGAVTA